jgi:acetyl-CoA carboxylase carboxyl transferase subunit beta
LPSPAPSSASSAPRSTAPCTADHSPPDVQTAENLLHHGIVDDVVPPAQLAAAIADVLTVCAAKPRPTTSHHGESPQSQPTASAWEAVTATRRSDRLGARDLIIHHTSNRVRLSGTGRGESAAGLDLALARFGEQPCVLIAQDRHAQASEPMGPGSLRAARRAIRIATDLQLPIVTIIDTEGAELSVEAEQGALAGEIASCLADLHDTPVPTLSVLLGQGSGGGALALMPADRTLATRNAWLTPLPPEGASAIVHGTPGLAEQTVANQHIRSIDLLRLGAIDAIVPEDGDNRVSRASLTSRVAAAIQAELARLCLDPSPVPERLARRYRRYRQIVG